MRKILVWILSYKYVASRKWDMLNADAERLWRARAAKKA